MSDHLDLLVFEVLPPTAVVGRKFATQILQLGPIGGLVNTSLYQALKSKLQFRRTSGKPGGNDYASIVYLSNNNEISRQSAQQQLVKAKRMTGIFQAMKQQQDAELANLPIANRIRAIEAAVLATQARLGTSSTSNAMLLIKYGAIVNRIRAVEAAVLATKARLGTSNVMLLIKYGALHI